MRNTLSAMVAAVLVAGVTMANMTAAGKDVTLKGEVIDAICYTKNGAGKGTGDGHAACATSCAKRGNEMAILTADGVYTIAGDYTKDKNAKLIEFVAKQVQATGTVTEKDGKKVFEVSAMGAAK